MAEEEEDGEGSDDWLQFFMRQPEISEAERLAGASQVRSFRMVKTDGGLMVKLALDFGPPFVIEMSPTVALYLQEYIAAALRDGGVVDD